VRSYGLDRFDRGSVTECARRIHTVLGRAFPACPASPRTPREMTVQRWHICESNYVNSVLKWPRKDGEWPCR
jgi:hypothetical protein